MLPNGSLISVTPTVLNADAYDAGDTLFDTTEVTNAAPFNGAAIMLQSLVLLDKDDQTAAAMAVYILDSNVTFGVLDAAPSITDANATAIIGHIALAAGDFVDIGGAKVACIENIGIMCKPASGRHLYVAATCAGTPTQTTGGIVLRLGFRWLY